MEVRRNDEGRGQRRRWAVFSNLLIGRLYTLHNPASRRKGSAPVVQTDVLPHVICQVLDGFCFLLGKFLHRPFSEAQDHTVAALLQHEYELSARPGSSKETFEDFLHARPDPNTDHLFKEVRRFEAQCLVSSLNFSPYSRNLQIGQLHRDFYESIHERVMEAARGPNGLTIQMLNAGASISGKACNSGHDSSLLEFLLQLESITLIFRRGPDLIALERTFPVFGCVETGAWCDMNN